jgi:MtfA peptidase
MPYIRQNPHMPPGDTLILLSDTTGISAANRKLLDSILRVYNMPRAQPLVEKPRFLYPEWMLFLFTLAGLFVLFMLYVGLPYLRKQRRLRKPILDEIGHSAIQYEIWLNQYNPYFASLSEPMKERFLDRVVKFMMHKEFRYHKLEADEMIPVLISGAAVQMTFGLRNFLMDFFPVIHITSKEYVMHHDNETYFGHVSQNGIYISWAHFLAGYQDYTDSINVGLHEMAHAVSYDVFLGMQDRHDRSFKERLLDFRIEGGPIYRAMREGDPHLLDEYATTNFDEFWAVCIETYFENPVELRDEEPGLYQAICDLLNQDPTRTDKVIDQKVAGIKTG